MANGTEPDDEKTQLPDHAVGESRREKIRAPRGVGTGLTVFVVLVVAAGVYLIAVRREALFVDLAGLSGMLFCF